MLPIPPEDWPRLFEQYVNAGDIEAVVALYAPDAHFQPRRNESVWHPGPKRRRDL
ncbi:MAG: hypothetical protein JWN14_4356 [Chthonomonadales bacterium]|nr:hypothetical protein [Chthonomonadales bacterium]